MPSLTPIQTALSPTSLPTDYLNKELELTYPVCLLYSFTFLDGSTLKLSNIPLNAVESGITGFTGPDGDYLGRVSGADLSTIQSFSTIGVSVMTSIKIHLIDSDAALTNIELSHGFKGAQVVVRVMQWQPGTLNFSVPVVKFAGYCEAPVHESNSNTISVMCKVGGNLSRQGLPSWVIQAPCSNDFPSNIAEQTAAKNDRYSPFFGCGYSPLAGGPGTSGFTICGKTTTDCIARGMYFAPNLRYTGSTFVPPQSFRGNQFVSGSKVTGFSGNNQSKYGQTLPIQIGAQWTQCVTMNSVGDPNTDRAECVLFTGEIAGPSSINEVVVNDVLIPFNGSDTAFTWYTVSSGARTGRFNAIPGYVDGGGNPVSDQYGSQCTIVVVVPQTLSQAPSAPKVQVLSKGTNEVGIPSTTNPADRNSWPRAYATTSDDNAMNPVWAVAHLLTMWLGYLWSQFNIQSMMDVATRCNVLISYTNANGGSGAHERFRCAFVIQTSKEASQYIDAILNTFNCHIDFNESTGLLDFVMESTLAEQQGNVAYFADSSGIAYTTNWPNPVASVMMDGTTANGYVAYWFDEDSILDSNDGTYTRLRIATPPPSMLGNSLSVRFQDQERGYVWDSITQTDPDAYARNNYTVQKIPYPLFGFDSYDQAIRITAQRIAINNYGNPRADGGGTLFLEIATTIKGLHLKPRQLVWVSSQKLQLTKQLFRVLSISPTPNFEELVVLLAWHRDSWYLDAEYQPGSVVTFKDPNTYGAFTDRPPYPIKPFNTLVEPTGGLYTFGVSQSPASSVSGIAGAQAGGGENQTQLNIFSCIPINYFSQNVTPPLIPNLVLQLTPSGGAFLVGHWCVGICAIDSAGSYSTMSQLAAVQVVANNSQITIPNIWWNNPAAVQQYQVFFGESEISMIPFYSAPVTCSGAPPATLTLASSTNLGNYNAGIQPYPSYGPPDVKLDSILLRSKNVLHAGYAGSAIASVTLNAGNTDILLYTGFTNSIFVSRTLCLVGRPGGGQTPLILGLVLSNVLSTQVITIAGDYTTGANQLMVGDVVMVMSQCESFTSPDTITCNGFNNGAYGALGVNAEVGRHLILSPMDDPLSFVIEFKIVSNTGNTITVDPPFIKRGITDPTGRFFIIANPVWDESTSVSVHQSSAPDTPVQLGSLVLSNWNNAYVLIQLITQNQNGVSSFETQAPSRVIWVFDSSQLVIADTTIAAGINNVTVDVSAATADVTITLPAVASLTSRVTVQRVGTGAHNVVVKHAGTDTITGVASVLLDSTQMSSITVYKPDKNASLTDSRASGFYGTGTGGGGGGIIMAVSTTATIPLGVSKVYVDGTTAPYTITVPDPSTLTTDLTLVRSETPPILSTVTITPAVGTLNGGLASLPLDNSTYSSITIGMP